MSHLKPEKNTKAQAALASLNQIIEEKKHKSHFSKWVEDNLDVIIDGLKLQLSDNTIPKE